MNKIVTPGNPPKKEGPILAQTGTPNPKKITCPYCDRQFNDTHVLADHIKEQHPAKYKPVTFA
jgi:hypothetical protein